MSTATSTTDEHRDPRISVTDIRGIVSQSEISLPCLFQNVSERGFLLLWSGTTKLGNHINVELKLSSGSIFCVAKVMWISDDVMGCRILEISDCCGLRLKLFIEEHYAKIAHRENARIDYRVSTVSR